MLDAVVTIDPERLTRVHGGSTRGEVCRAAWGTAFGLGGAAVGFVPYGGPAAQAAMKGAKLAKISPGMKFGTGADNALNAVADGHTGLALLDAGATAASFVPGPVGSVATAYSAYRMGQELGTSFCPE